MPLGDPFKPVYFDDACNIVGSFILTTFTCPHTHRLWRQPYFYDSFVLTRTFRVSSVLSTAHSHHRHFVDSRHIGCTIRLRTAFHSDITILFGQLSADFCELSNTSYIAVIRACRSLRVGVSGRYPIIPPIEISVL